MKKLVAAITILLTIFTFAPSAFADGGIYASGGGTKTVGETFTITVQARGAEFDSLQGTISISGPVDVVSFSAGGASWMPGYTPSNGKTFVGIVSPTSSFTVATIKLKGKSVGSGSVSVSGTKMARTIGGSASIVGSGSGGASFSIQRALVLPGSIVVSSSTHPDQNVAYDGTAVALSWTKDSNVSGFSYIYDQVADTVPQAKVNSSDTSVAYQNQAIGIYYFHIRALNGDGWGSTTHFKVTIKEPDPKVSETLSKPHDIVVSKAQGFENIIEDGTISGIIISGVTEPGFMANVILNPLPKLPEGKVFSIKADETGKFEYIVDFPIDSGFYKLTIQGQNDKTLTPISDPIKFEISQAKGGTISLLSDADKFAPIVKPLKWYEKIHLSRNIAFYLFAGLVLVIVVIGSIVLYIKKRKTKKQDKTIKVPADV